MSIDYTGIGNPKHPYFGKEDGNMGGRRTSHATSFNFSKLENPIPKEIKDSKEIKTFFEKYPYVPYSGTYLDSQQTLLNFFNNLTDLSPTLGACINSIGFHSFGGSLEIVKDSKLDFYKDAKEEIPDDVQAFYMESLKEIDFGKRGLKDLHHLLYDTYKSVGVCYLEVVMSETLGVKSGSVHFHDSLDCFYRLTERGKPKLIDISSSWELDYLLENPPRTVPEFPHYAQYPDGTIRTIMTAHSGNYEWYGRPDWKSCFVHAYREFQDSIYLARISDNNFTGQVIIEVEDDEFSFTQDEEAQGAGFDNLADRVEQNFTNKSPDPMTVLMMSRPYGSKPVAVEQIEPNTNENFYKETGAIAERKIIQNNNWSARILSSDAGSAFSTNVFLDDLRTKEPLLTRYRKIINGLVSQAVSEINKYKGNDSLLELGVRSRSPFQEMLDQLDVNDGTNNQKGNDPEKVGRIKEE